MGGSGGGAGVASPAGPCGGTGPAGWLRILNRMEAMLRKSQAQIESLVADREHLESVVKIQHDRIQMMRKQERNRRRVEAAELQLLLTDKERELRCYENYAELTDHDLEDFKTCYTDLAAENTELKCQIKLKEVQSRAAENIERDSREEPRELKKAYKSLCSKKDSDVPVLKSKITSRRKMVTTQKKRKCSSSVSNGLTRCSSRLQSKAPVSPANPLFSPSFKVPKVKAPTPC